MKNILILLILTLCSNSFGKSPKRYAADLIINGDKGTGFFLKIKNRNYIITNAHVCIGKEIYSDYTKGKKFAPNKKFKFSVNNQKMSVPFKSLILNVSYDLCLIPAQKGGDFKISAGLFWEDVFYYTFDFRGNSLKRAGKIISRPNTNLELETSEDKSHNQKEGVLLSTNTLQGDSGSLVFNNKNEVVGIIFGHAVVKDSEDFLGYMVPGRRILETID